MKQAVLKSLYDLHSWIGLFVGAVLYVVCLSGTAALFAKEIAPWDRGGSVYSGNFPFAGLDGALADAAAASISSGIDENDVNLNVMLPGFYADTIRVRAGGQVLSYDPETGARVPARNSASAEVLVRLHTDLLLPHEIGRHVVGVLGVVMMLSIISGIVLHRRYIRDAFTFRMGRSMRRLWTDAHKAIGMWTLPFQFLMAFTGAILGFIPLVLLPAVLLSFQGDQVSAAQALDIGTIVEAGEAAKGQPANDILSRSRAALPNFVPEQMIYERYGRDGATVRVFGNRQSALVYYPAVSVDAVSGDVNDVIDWSLETPGKRVYAMVTPIHYGSFGGVWLKGGYALLGLAVCILIASGLSIWKSRLAAFGTTGKGRYFLAFLNGTFFGSPFSCVAFVVMGRLLPQSIGADQSWMTILFLSLYMSGIGWCAWRPTSRTASWGLFLACGLMLMSFPIITAVASYAEGLSWVMVYRVPIIAVDLIAFVVGAITAVVALRMRSTLQSKEVWQDA